jgi:Zn-dependent protease
VAKRNGIGIAGIDLWLLGGVAKMERDTDSPGLEFRVAAAGPLVTLLIAIVCFAVGALVGGAEETLNAATFDPENGSELLAVLGYLSLINVLLLVFNLVPAFPLDGGRIARAAAWKVTGDRSRATRVAANLGRVLAFLMVAAGIFFALQGAFLSGIWLAFVGYTLGQAARSTVLQTELTSRLEGMRVADVMDAEPVSIFAHMTLDRAYDENFRRYGYPWFPVVDSDRRLVGLVTRQSIEALPDEELPDRTVASVMAVDAGARLRVGMQEPLENLLGLDGLRRLGAIMAVDSDGRLQGIVTEQQVRSALGIPAAA